MNFKDFEQGYKLFYAGSGGQDNGAISFQEQTGWKRIFGSDNDGLNGDTWVVYKDLEALPKWLQDFAKSHEALGTVLLADGREVRTVNSLNYGLTFTQHYNEAQLIEEFGKSHEHSLSDTTDILFDSADERSQFVSELANDYKGIENVSSWESWSNSPSDSDKFNASSISLADMQNVVSSLDDSPAIKYFYNDFYKECPALRHLSTKGIEKINDILMENPEIKTTWKNVKDYIYNQPELKELKNEINECKIKEQRILNQNKDLNLALGN